MVFLIGYALHISNHYSNARLTQPTAAHGSPLHELLDEEARTGSDQRTASKSPGSSPLRLANVRGIRSCFVS